ncbi:MULTISPECIES: hypothetical protein [Caballeronia]|jgi:hypothetical protein|uniref:Uncharacterized protein n=1 Tax=Caballeronia jiangsuensis TaxID=1458357 RepID=A0ABW9CW17_9BURK|nr:hypothetical protein [Caballeronia sp. GaOx3]
MRKAASNSDATAASIQSYARALPVQKTPHFAAHVELARNNCSAGYSSGAGAHSRAPEADCE